MFVPKGIARCGVRTHAILRLSELKSDALDHSANLAQLTGHWKFAEGNNLTNTYYILKSFIF